MPVCLNSIPAMLDTSPLARWLCNDRPLEAKESSDRCLRIGLINNMPDGALEATENQFIPSLIRRPTGFRFDLHFIRCQVFRAVSLVLVT